MTHINVTSAAWHRTHIGTVSVLGTSRVAEMDAMTRASKLAATYAGEPWAVAWQSYGTDGGTIDVSVSDDWNAGRTIARWVFVR